MRTISIFNQLTFLIGSLVVTSSYALPASTHPANQSSLQSITCSFSQPLLKLEGSGKGAPVDDQKVVDPEQIFRARVPRELFEIIDQDREVTEYSQPQDEVWFVAEPAFEDQIKWDRQIIEDQNDYAIKPLYLNKTIEEVIRKDHQIIESNFQDSFEPLWLPEFTMDSKLLKKETFIN